MLYDDHFKLGQQHAAHGEPRYVWSDPHLQEAYDRGYYPNALTEEFRRRMSQSIPGMPGLVSKPLVKCSNCGYAWYQSSTARIRCANCGHFQ